MEISDLLNELVLGPKGIWVLLTSLILGVLMFRMTHAIVYALVGVLIHFFGYLAPIAFQGAEMSEILELAGETASTAIASPTNLVVLYIIYLALISVIFFIKSLFTARR